MSGTKRAVQEPLITTGTLTDIIFSDEVNGGAPLGYATGHKSDQVLFNEESQLASIGTLAPADGVTVTHGGTAELATPAQVVNAGLAVVNIAALTRAYAALVDGMLIEVLGWAAEGDGGGGFFVWIAASTTADDGGLTINPTGHSGAGRWSRLLTPVSDYASDVRRDCGQHLYRYRGRAPVRSQCCGGAWAPTEPGAGERDPYVVKSTIAISGIQTILGDGPDVSQISMQFNGALFTWTNNSNVSGFDVGDFSVSGQFSGAYTSSNIFLIQGTGLLQYGTFHDINSFGIYKPFEINMTTFSTSFGPSSPFAWNPLDRISILAGQQNAYYGFVFDEGSGTGNAWHDIKSNLSGSAAPCSTSRARAASSAISSSTGISGAPAARCCSKAASGLSTARIF